MEEYEKLWNCEATLAGLGIEVPEWVDQDITGRDIAAICQGGCESGAYMPAVTYHEATQTMAEHGDEVLEYIEDAYGELPDVPRGESWSGIAVHFLSCAVELWAGSITNDVVEALEDRAENPAIDLLASAAVESCLGVLSPVGRASASLEKLLDAMRGQVEELLDRVPEVLSPAILDALRAHVAEFYTSDRPETQREAIREFVLSGRE